MTDAPHEDPHAAAPGRAGRRTRRRRHGRPLRPGSPPIPRWRPNMRRLVALRDAMKARLAAAGRARRRCAAASSRWRRPRPARPAAAPARRSGLLDPRYRALAASLALGIVLGAGCYRIAVPQLADDDVQRAIVAGFIRGRLSGQTVDVATSDRHTVKPWLAGKIAGATTVVDLKADGFPLVGGRDRRGRQDAGSDARLSAPRAPDRAERNARPGGRFERAAPRCARWIFAARMGGRRPSLRRGLRHAAVRARRLRGGVSQGRRGRARGDAKALTSRGASLRCGIALVRDRIRELTVDCLRRAAAKKRDAPSARPRLVSISSWRF